MKKIISVLLIISLVLSLGVISSFADGEATEAKASSYLEGAEVTPGVWLNQFDADWICIGTISAIFNAAAPFTAIVFPNYYAGKSENDQEADSRFELFAFTGEQEESLKADPVFKWETTVDGDQIGFKIDLGKTFPAGQYIFRVSEISENPDQVSPGPYAVVPAAEAAYGTDVIAYFSPITTQDFAFDVIYDGSVPASEFFKPLEFSTPKSFKDDKAVQVVARSGNNPHEIMNVDFAILTPEIPEGKVLRYFTFKNAPTWSNTNHDSDLDFDVYVWDTDYSTTYGSRPIKSGSVLDHADNQDLTLDFGARLTAGNRYLIVVYRSGEGKIGFWGGDTILKEGWVFFEDEEETDMYLPACEYKLSVYTGPAETPEPTEEPTPTPDVTEAPEITEAPEVTEAPPAEETEAPTLEPTAEPEKKTGCGGFVAGGFVSVCVLAAALFISKKKD